MTSGPHAQTNRRPAGSDIPDIPDIPVNTGSTYGTDDTAARLWLKPDGPQNGRFDGGWWPRSLDLLTELPALSEALTDRLGAVIRIAYALDSWQDQPRRGKLTGRIVRLEGFRSQDPHTVQVTGANGRRLSLRVIPPNTAGAEAETTLRDAAESTSDDSASRWNSDGGHS
jgi:hypothetical protein